jgi:hypothetical protein
LVTDSHSILARWWNQFPQLLNVHGINIDRQTEINTAEPQVPEPSVFEAEVAIENLKTHKSPGTDQIPGEVIKTEGRAILSYIHNFLILFGIRRNCLRNGRSLSLYLFISRVIKQILVIIATYHFCQLRTKYPKTFCQV